MTYTTTFYKHKNTKKKPKSKQNKQNWFLLNNTNLIWWILIQK